jgi:hypothetical protein
VVKQRSASPPGRLDAHVDPERAGDVRPGDRGGVLDESARLVHERALAPVHADGVAAAGDFAHDAREDDPPLDRLDPAADERHEEVELVRPHCPFRLGPPPRGRARPLELRPRDRRRHQ